MNHIQKIDRAYDELKRAEGGAGYHQNISVDTFVVYDRVDKNFEILNRMTHECVVLNPKEMRSLYKYIKRVLIDES